MTGTKSKPTILLIALILALAVVAAALKMIFSHSVKDSFFVFDFQKLQHVPANIVVVHPTHFQNSFHKGVISSGASASRTLGRDVTFAQIMAAAYDVKVSRVTLPPDAPKGNFDFLVTTATNSMEQLRAVIKKTLGYTAHKEMRDTAVFWLTVETPDAPGLHTSPDREKAAVNFRNGIIYFVHQPANVWVGPMERYLKTPVLDRTGLTNFYDFSVNWDWRMGNGSMNEATTKRMLNLWGLGLEPGTAPIEMLVVEKAH